MKEVIYNLFYFSPDEKNITHVGIVPHEFEGNDDEKIAFLQKNVEVDLSSCRSFHNIHPSVLDSENVLTLARYHSNMRIGNSFSPFELALAFHNAPLEPIAVMTAVVKGKCKIDVQVALSEKLRNKHMPDYKIEGVRTLPDYLDEYMDGDALHIKDLLNDDHMKPIKLLFNNKHYLASFKLFMSFIDTIAYLEYGNSKRVFQNWLENYSEINKLEITADELYELRNSLLHMTNLNSHKVIQGKERRLSFSVCEKGHPTRYHNDIVYINYLDLLFIFDEAIDKWLETYHGSSKQLTLIERYDEVVRDNY
ncbi:hypothetical protein H4F52_08495 [Pectobacterium brasiliense]|uniref:hypothetical protein n=1 Tax=Pectobacterium brasiliense TaxID=180957 RepID=UPI001968E915|nr:hypothetical protein [Pectobacterium brasiliense]MBN3131776.1 hypothetical protein [Pectobacterium brasiliense]